MRHMTQDRRGLKKEGSSITSSRNGAMIKKNNM